MDIDPERVWFFSVTFGHDDLPFCGEIAQGDATTRLELIVMILGAFGLPMYTRVAVHHLERNDL